jgi:hypothetical protein
MMGPRDWWVVTGYLKTSPHCDMQQGRR